jgi:hypothetical protein
LAEVFAAVVLVLEVSADLTFAVVAVLVFAVAEVLAAVVLVLEVSAYLTFAVVAVLGRVEKRKP